MMKVLFLIKIPGNWLCRQPTNRLQPFHAHSGKRLKQKDSQVNCPTIKNTECWISDIVESGLKRAMSLHNDFRESPYAYNLLTKVF